MPSNLPPEPSLYVEGFHAGEDVGLRVALDALTAERISQTLLRATHEPGSPAAARHEYCEARLVAVSKVIGAHFRQ
jgi:hypothetical protein